MPACALTAGGAHSYKNSLVEEFSNNIGGWKFGLVRHLDSATK